MHHIDIAGRPIPYSILRCAKDTLEADACTVYHERSGTSTREWWPPAAAADFIHTIAVWYMTPFKGTTGKQDSDTFPFCHGSIVMGLFPKKHGNH